MPAPHQVSGQQYYIMVMDSDSSNPSIIINNGPSCTTTSGRDVLVCADTEAHILEAYSTYNVDPLTGLGDKVAKDLATLQANPNLTVFV